MFLLLLLGAQKAVSVRGCKFKVDFRRINQKNVACRSPATITLMRPFQTNLNDAEQ